MKKDELRTLTIAASGRNEVYISQVRGITRIHSEDGWNIHACYRIDREKLTELRDFINSVLNEDK